MSHRFPDRTAVFNRSEELFCNPHKGFTSFQRFRGDRLNSDWRKDCGWMMERIPSQEGLYVGEVSDYPDPSIAYFRIPWQRLEPQEGVFDFSFLDFVLETATARGQRVMLRFPAHAARPGDLDLPHWFCEKIGVQAREIGDKASPRNPLYYSLYDRFIEAVGAHIDGDWRVSGVDMALVGAWGEGEGIDMLPEAEWKCLVDAYIHAFPKTPLCAQFNHAESIQYANSARPVGIRADCLGNMIYHMLNCYPRAFGEFHTLWEKAPIAFESCWVIGYWLEQGWDLDYIIEQSLKWHITSLNAKSSPVPLVWKDKVEAWIKKMGYRYAVRRIDYPTEAKAGDVLQMSFWLENYGVAPIYHRYPFVLRLRGAASAYDIPMNADITAWLPGDILLDEAVRLPGDIAEGRYAVEVGITDGTTLVRLATDTPCTNGFNKIGEINIVR